MPQLSTALLEVKLSGRQSFPHQGWTEASSKLYIPTEIQMFLVSVPLFAFLLEEEIIALSYLFIIIIN